MAGEKLAGYVAGVVAIGLLAINGSFNDNAGTCRVNNEKDTVEILSAKDGKVVQSYPKENVAIFNGECLIGQGSSAVESFKLQ